MFDLLHVLSYQVYQLTGVRDSAYAIADWYTV